MCKAFLIPIFIIIGFQSFSQSKKDIKKNKIATIVVTETANGKTIDDSKVSYDVNGEIIEKSEYLKDGTLKKTVKYKLNNLGDVVEENEYDEKNTLKEQTIISYNALGDKKEELVYDGNKKLLKKHVYIYNSKGLKTERKTFDSSGKLVGTKKYTYTFK